MLLPKLPRRLDLLPIGGVEGELLAWLGPQLDERFGTSSTLRRSLPLREGWIDEERGQGRSNAIVDALTERTARSGVDPRTHWVLGVLEIDLYAAGRPFVFGEATVRGCCAVVSLARLRPAPGPLPPGPSLLHTRVLKEAVHELGHVAGLGHCEDPGCVMSESPGVEEVDRKGNGFCGGCRLALRDLLAKRGA